MPQEIFSPRITDIGRAAAISASGNRVSVDITHVSLGSGRSDTAATGAAASDLISRVETVPIAGGASGPDSFRVSVIFGPAATAYPATEMGFWMGDPAAGGKLFAVWSVLDPLSYITHRHGGAQFIATFGVALFGIPSGVVNIVVDPSASVALALIGEHERAADPHPQYGTKRGIQSQQYVSGAAAGDGETYTLALTPPLADLSGMPRVNARFAQAGKADSLLTLNVSGTGAKPIFGRRSDGSLAPLPGREIAAGMIVDLVFDGNAWVAMSRLPTSVVPVINPATASSLPAFGGGTGTQADPLVIAPSVGAPGAQGVRIASITIPGLPPGSYVPIADLNDASNGARFTPSNHVANGSGTLTFDILFSDTPTSAVGAKRDLLLSVGDLFIKHARTTTNATVTLAPSITAPANGSTTTSTTPTFSTTPYATSGGSDTHRSTGWEVATDPGFVAGTIIMASDGDTSNLTTWTAPSPLPFATTLYVRARHVGNTSGASENSPVVSFVTPVQVTTAKPSITMPSAGATGVSDTPTITSSPMTLSSGGAGGHTSSSWAIATDPGFVTVVAGSNLNSLDLTSWTPTNPLAKDVIHYARVKHYSVQGGASAWSDAVAFRTAAAAAINTPEITAPAAGLVGFAGAVTCSPFGVSNGSDAHSGSSWQVATDAAFVDVVEQVQNSAVNKLTWSPTNLQPGTTYYVRVAHHGLSLPMSAWSLSRSFTTLSVTVPLAPTVAGGATAAMPGTVVTGSAYAANGTSPHHNTDWELSTSPTFSPLAAGSSLADTVNLTAWTIPAGLTPSTTYYLRARYRSAAGVASAYSGVTSFDTSAAPTTNTPTITAPAAGALTTNPPSITTDAFGVSVGSDTHEMTTWQIARDAAFTDIVAALLNNSSNLVAWTPADALPAGGTYYLRARHKATSAGWSAYSAAVIVTTAAAPKTAVTSITSPTADQVGFAGVVTTAPFARTSGTGVHSVTDWQFSTDETFATVVHAVMNDAVNKTALPTAGIAELTPGAYYYVRARHHDAALGASAEYSTPVRFRRIKTAKPQIVSPTSGATGVSKVAELESSAFSSDGPDTHAGSEWQVSRNSAFTLNIVDYSGPGNLVSIKLSGATASTTYYARVRHAGANGLQSEWSDTVAFTTNVELGTAWTEKTAGIPTTSLNFGQLFCVAFGAGVFVAAGYGKVGSTSSPLHFSVDYGKTFSPCTGIPAASLTNQCTTLIYTGQKFIAVLSDKKVIESVDGKVWAATAGAVAPTTTRNGAAYDGAVLVSGSLSASGRLMYSTNAGASWTDCVGAPSGSSGGVCYSEQLDLFVASIGGYAYTSPDGMTFTKRGAIPVGSSATTGEMYFSNGVFLALSSGGLARSTDGMTWTKVISSAIGTKTPGCAHFVDGAWYMVVYQSLSGYLLRSVDNGLTWVQIFAFATTDIAHGMAFGGGTLIYVGTDVYVTEVDNGDGTTTTTEKYFASWTYCSQ